MRRKIWTVALLMLLLGITSAAAFAGGETGNGSPVFAGGETGNGSART